jgi:hypothetical protein
MILNQRNLLVMLSFSRVRMHYGHPDVFDRIFHITRGGISKASRVINISEDIYAGRCVLFFTFKFHHEFDGGSCAWLYLMLGTGLNP